MEILQYGDFEGRALEDPHGVEIAEVRLFDHAVGEGDLLSHCRRQAIDGAGNQLCLDDARIERCADIGGDPYLLDADARRGVRHLDDLADPAAER